MPFPAQGPTRSFPSLLKLTLSVYPFSGYQLAAALPQEILAGSASFTSLEPSRTMAANPTKASEYARGLVCVQFAVVAGIR